MSRIEQNNGRGTQSEVPPDSKQPEIAVPYWNLRHAVGKYFYSLLDLLGDKYGLGYSESINILFFLIAFTFTTGWVLMPVWAAHFTYAKIFLSAFYLLHLASGIWLVWRTLRRGKALTNEDLKSKSKLTWWHLVAGYVVAFIAELITFWHIWWVGHKHDDQGIHGPEITLVCLVMLGYLFCVFVFYRYWRSAYWLEGILGPFELVLWSLLVFFTGGAQSRFIYLYYLTLVPLLRRGVPDEEKQLKELAKIRGGRKLTRLQRHRLMWVFRLWYPLFWLIALQVLTVTLWIVLPPHGSIMEELARAYRGGLAGVAPLLSRLPGELAQAYLSNAPWLLLLGIMAVLTELETDSLNAVTGVMKKKAREDWNKYVLKDRGELLRHIVGELGYIINKNYFFRCSGILAVSFNSHSLKSAGDGAHETRAYQLDGVSDLTAETLAEFVESVSKASVKARPEARFDPIEHFHLYQEGAAHESDIATDYFYYLKERGDRGRYEEFRGPIVRALGYDGDFFNDDKADKKKRVASLCSIILSHPDPSGEGHKSFTLVFFKSDLPGQFDEPVTSLYEMLFTQIVGIFKKYELYVTRERAAADERARTKAASGLLHNVKNLIGPALSSSQAARESFGELENPVILDLDPPEEWDSVEGFWAGYLNAAESTRKKFNEVREQFEKEGAPADLIMETLNAYFEYIRSNNAKDLTPKRLGLILEQILECLHGAWKFLPALAVTTQYRPAGISDEEWSRRQDTLNRFRRNNPRPQRGKWLMWAEQGSAGSVSYRLSCGCSAIDVPAGVIAQHVLYEIAWNAAKFGGVRHVLGSERDNYRVRVVGVCDQKELRLRVSQGPCSRAEVEKVLNTLNPLDSEKTEARGLAGVRYLAERYGWKFQAEHGCGPRNCRKLKVTLCISLTEV